MSLKDLIKSTLNTSKDDIENNSSFIIQEIPITNENWKLFVILILLSTIFLLSSVVIYLLLWDKQKCSGWTQFSYLLSFLFFNLVFIPALCPGIASGSEINTRCFILSVLNQLFFISSKTWLLIIGFDILKNLWKYQLIQDGKHYTTLITYSFFGWTFPLVFVGCGVILNLTHQEKLRNQLYYDGLWTAIPDYGHLHCRIPNWTVWEIFVFSNCICHFVIFGLIIFVILQHRYSVREAFDSNSSSRPTTHKSIVIFVKLFFVVGLSWSYIALQDLLKAGNINTNQGWVWHVFRIIFFLQGVFISILYVCNGKTVRLLQDKYPRFRNFADALRKLINFLNWEQLRRESLSTLSTLSTSLHMPRRSRVWNISESSSGDRHKP